MSAAYRPPAGDVAGEAAARAAADAALQAELDATQAAGATDAELAAHAALAATDAELAAHVADETAVHGIADTALLVLDDDARLSDDRDPTAHVHAQADVTALAAALTEAKARANHTGVQTAATISDFTEAVQDAVAALLGEGSNITLTYDDGTDTLTIEAASGGGGLDEEAARDAIGIALIGAGLVSVAVNDGADTITISTTATANATDAQLRDRATHTGAQAIATVTGLQAALDALQPLDGDLTAIAGLGPANDDVIQRKAGAWTNRTMAQIKTDLALVKADVGLGNVDNTSDATKHTDTALTGNPTAATQAAGNNSTRLATTAYVMAESGLLVPKSIVDAAGDLIVGGGVDAVARLPAPTSDDDVLTADLGEALKMKWAAPTGGGSSEWTRVDLPGDVANSTTAFADITSLSFAVASGTTYEFRFWVEYTAAVTTTGAKFSLNGPAFTKLVYISRWGNGGTAESYRALVAYDDGTAGANSLLTGNLAEMHGYITPSASGTLIARFASEVGTSAITAKVSPLSYVEYREVT